MCNSVLPEDVMESQALIVSRSLRLKSENWILISSERSENNTDSISKPRPAKRAHKLQHLGDFLDADILSTNSAFFILMLDF